MEVNMTITMKKVSEGLYVVSATPPHVREAWSTTEPLHTDQIIQELLSRGAHQTDVGDAFYEQDRDWVKK
jgi:hypothetical protein